MGGNNELPRTERGLIYQLSGSCSYCLVSSHSNVVRGFLVIASITPAATKEIFETVEISKSSICRSCSCVKLPSRRLNLINCVRAMSLASLRVALVSSVALTPGLSSFLPTRLSFSSLFGSKDYSDRQAFEAGGPVSPAEETLTSSTTIQQPRAHFEKCLLKLVGNACTDKRNAMNKRETLICGTKNNSLANLVSSPWRYNNAGDLMTTRRAFD